jgi:hypothetical protein
MTTWAQVMREVAGNSATSVGPRSPCGQCGSRDEVHAGSAVSRGRYRTLCRRCWWTIAKADSPSATEPGGRERTDDELQALVDAER